MALIKNEEEREIAMLENLEHRIQRREKRERIHRLLICGLGLLSVAAFFTGHSMHH